MFRDEREAALARADAAEQRAEELEVKVREGQAKISELEAALAERDAELAKLRPVVESAAARKSEARAKKQREREKSAERARRERVGRPSWLSEHKGSLGVTAGIALFVAGMIFGIRACNQHRAMNGPGDLVSSQVVRLADGKQALLFVSKVEQEDDPDDYRLDLVDPGSGTRLKRLVLEKHERGAGVTGAAPGRIWIAARSAGQLELRALPGLEPTARWEDLVKATPALAAGLHGQIEVDGSSGKALVTTKTGEQLLIDPVNFETRPIVPKRETLTVEHNLGGGVLLLESIRKSELLKSAGTLYPGPSFMQMESGVSYRMSRELVPAWRAFPRLRSFGSSSSGTASGVELAGLTYSFGGSPRATLHVQRPSAQSEPIPGSPGLIRPTFVATGSDATALTLPEGGGFIVCHQQTLESPQNLLFSRMTPDGMLHFTFTAPGHTVKLAHLAGDVVVLAIERSRAAYLLGLGWREGRERWRYPL